MSSTNSHNNKNLQIISTFVFSCLFMLSSCGVKSVSSNHTTQNFSHADEAKKLNLIRARLMKINKPAVKTIHSPDGDIIDCVLSHKQPAFDHPLLQGQKPMDPPDWPRGYNESTTTILEKSFQVWSMSNETCPEGTIPIKKATEQDLLRESSIRGVRRKFKKRSVGRYNSGNTHEHALAYVKGDKYYGAKATMNVWAPRVAVKSEFSLSQLWVLAGDPDVDLNSVEAGWQVSRDNQPRLFTYWTGDAYKSKGCYNLACPGFVQTNKKIALGAVIAPTSTYNGRQFEIDILVWKDPKSGNWWLTIGNGILIGYWPSVLFTHLKDHADEVQFGGEIVNTATGGSHTTTQMGSGHFAEEGPGKAAYFRNLELTDFYNNLNIVQGLQFFMPQSNCYDIQGKYNKDWGNYFYYGGPGKNPKCP